jgi:hypothetical protein
MIEKDADITATKWGAAKVIEARFNRGDNVRIISSGKIGTINEVLIRSDNIGYRVTVDGKIGAYQS